MVIGNWAWSCEPMGIMLWWKFHSSTAKFSHRAWWQSICILGINICENRWWKCLMESSTHDARKTGTKIFLCFAMSWNISFLFFLVLFSEDDTKIQYHLGKVSDGERERYLTVSRPPKMNHLCGNCGRLRKDKFWILERHSKGNSKYSSTQD